MPHPVLSMMDEDEASARIQRAFRSVFSTEDGKIVLAVMLEDLKFFDPAANEADRVLSNYAKEILRKAGLTDSWDMTMALINVIPKEGRNA